MDADTKEKTPPKFVMRIDVNMKSLARWCRVFHTEFEKAKSNEDCISRVKTALEISGDEDFEEEVADNMDPLTRKLLWLLVKHYTKRNDSTSFSIKEQLCALAVLKHNPISYRFLKKIFILPSNAALKELISNQNLHAGINTHFFGFMEKRVANWSNVERLCVVILGIMDLNPDTSCSMNKDKTEEPVESNEQINPLADQALVFILRGAEYKWQLPIAFYLSERRPSSLQLKSIITSMICAISQTGLKPVALIPDHILTFQRVIDELLADSERDQLLAGENFDNSIHLGGNSLSVFYDPFHLTKDVSNNFESYDADYGGDRISWRDIVEGFETMRRVNSQSFTSAFKKYLDGKLVEPTLQRTKNFVYLIQKLLDSVARAGTVSETSLTRPLRRAITRKSKHHAFWEETITKLETITFVTNENERVNTPCINNWIITVRSYQRVWELLRAHKVKVMNNKNFVPGPVKEFFGQVRQYNSCDRPSPTSFVNSFKLLFLASFISDEAQINPFFFEFYSNSITEQK